MEVIAIKNKTGWDDVGAPFAQSWQWGNILISEDAQVERLSVKDGHNIIALAQIVYHELPGSRRYAFCPKGPTLIRPHYVAQIVEIYATLSNYLFTQGCVFFRVEPEETIYGVKYRQSKDTDPRATIILDLNKNSEELFSQMHPKTRYNIRLAEKKNLRINREKNFDAFFLLLKETSRRDKFNLHIEKHYRRVLAADFIRQITVYLEEIPVAVGVFLVHSHTVTYLYGASNYRYRQLMAPYLVQWEGIKLAKILGCKKYDFFGVAPFIDCNYKSQKDGESFFQRMRRFVQDDKKIVIPDPSQDDDKNCIYDETHQYAGVTRFKMGFGGEYVEWPGTFDVILNKKEYLVYRILRKLRRWF